MGEICQYAAKLILRNLKVLGQEVKYVKPLKLPKNSGKRIDDWIITLSNDLQIPVEVKSSMGSRYFNLAFDQIKNALAVYKYAVFIGFSFLPNRASSQKTIVLLVNKTDNLETFSEKVKELLSAK